MSQDKKHLCPICKAEYDSKKWADQCMQKYGRQALKFKKGNRVLVNLENSREEIIGIITNYHYAKPDSHRKPHQLVYLIKVEASDGKILRKDFLTLTTATEEEMQLLTK